MDYVKQPSVPRRRCPWKAGRSEVGAEYICMAAPRTRRLAAYGWWDSRPASLCPRFLVFSSASSLPSASPSFLCKLSLHLLCCFPACFPAYFPAYLPLSSLRPTKSGNFSGPGPSVPRIFCLALQSFLFDSARLLLRFLVPRGAPCT